MIKNLWPKIFPNLVAPRLPRNFPAPFFHFFPKRVMGFFAAGETDHRHCGRQLAVSREIVKRGQKFAMSQIARRAKNDDAARLGDSARGKSFTQRIDFWLLGRSIHWINCSGALLVAP